MILVQDEACLRYDLAFISSNFGIGCCQSVLYNWVNYLGGGDMIGASKHAAERAIHICGVDGAVLSNVPCCQFCQDFGGETEKWDPILFQKTYSLPTIFWNMYMCLFLLVKFSLKH